ncbi:MAG: hypothetical protein A3F15_01455 [Candidatus Wildermuthbacteria bacterium RIFCSPHIGHO2_12_FULL_40_12]|uniref:Uncharacterized protein n=1 Tax=Candidatus Wildermuthbacteria bacterium RIFCSPHIGHO2_12_FULL_40_12 TaxID=1802457 RepID=A0A1G2RFW0_9BACT|nr:MAG: hypothetical protein A3F15_01455 [Candidatus Wildermuthbacteria bacterium RIFCSPHIGHO2_12_FULL_40_12]
MALIGKRALLHHLTIGPIAALLVYLFWLSRPSLDSDVRLWKALGNSAFVFLSATLIIGPLAKLWNKTARLISWRRETGIWYAFLAISHFLSVRGYALSEPGIKLPVLAGLTALFFTIALLITSSDAALKFLGASSWKWIHYAAYIIFYLSAGHALYFLFLRYDERNWFRYPFLILALLVITLQFAAFFKTVARQRKYQKLDDTQNNDSDN